MRRILLVLSVAALMAALLAVGGGPALALSPSGLDTAFGPVPDQKQGTTAIFVADQALTNDTAPGIHHYCPIVSQGGNC